MGYTHYWTKTKDWTDIDFAYFKAEAVAIFETSDVPTIETSTAPGELMFNGVEPDDFETFYISHDHGSEFCKTGYRPYDEVVTAVLICAKYHFGDAIEIRSDGVWDEWTWGRSLYQTTFPDRTVTSPLKERG